MNNSIHLQAPSGFAINWLKRKSHGVVYRRPDGISARCMGPSAGDDVHGFCQQCDFEQMIVGLLIEMGKLQSSDNGHGSRLKSFGELDHNGLKVLAP